LAPVRFKFSFNLKLAMIAIKRRGLAKRVARRNPLGAWKQMMRASARLEKTNEAFREGNASGKRVLAAAMRSAIAKQQVRKLLVLDAKFSIENNAAFNERMFGFLRSRKAKKPFSFAIVDLDFLKQLNNESYAQADNAIAIFAEHIARIAKKHSGFAGRFGGDELKIFVPKQPSVLASELDTIRKEMNALGLSFSGGASGLQNTMGFSPQAIVERLNKVANRALLKSKNTGRNKITTR